MAIVTAQHALLAYKQAFAQREAAAEPAPGRALIHDDLARQAEVSQHTTARIATAVGSIAVVIVALVLRYVFSGAERGLVEELWPGPQPTLDAVLRLSGRRAVVA